MTRSLSGRIVFYWRAISEFKQHNKGMLINLGPRNKYCSISELAFKFLNIDGGDDDISNQ